MTLQYKKLADLAEIIMGQSPPGESYNNKGSGLPFFQGKTEFGEIYPTVQKWCDKPIKIAEVGDILISVRAPVGSTNLANDTCCIGRGLAAIRVSQELDRDYLWFFLRASEKYLIGKGQGSTFESINASDLCLLEIPTQHINIQRQIAAKLKAQLAEVETSRKVLQAQQAEIKYLAETIFDSLFNYPNKEKIGNIAKIQSGYSFKSKDFINQGIRLLRNTNILPNKIYWDDMACVPSESITQYPNYVINEGDVILSLDRPIISTGLKVARISNNDLPALLVQRVGRFLLDENKIDESHLYFFLNTSFFKEAISGHEQSLGVPHISPSQVENVEIPLPGIDEQKKIAVKASEVFKQIEIAKIAAKEAQKDIDYLPSRLLAQAFAPLTTIKE